MVLNNTGTSPEDRSVLSNADIVIYIVYGIIAVVSVLGNIMTILIIARNPTFHTLYNFLLMNLAVSDFLSGLFSIVQIISTIVFTSRGISPSQAGCTVFCMVMAGTIYMNIMVSVITLTVIAIERYLGIVMPLRHRNMTRNRLKYIIFLTWASSGALASSIAVIMLRMDDTSYYCTFSKDEKKWSTFILVMGWLALLFSFAVPLCLISYLYAAIIRHLRAAKRPGVGDTPTSQSTTTARKRSTKTVKMLIAITVFFAGGIIPEMVYFALVFYDRQFIDARLFHKLGMPVVASIAVNPFVYTLTNPAFREEAKHLILICCKRIGKGKGRVVTAGTTQRATQSQQ